MSADYIRALREERESYVARDLPDRVAQVDAELERLGALARVEEAPIAEAPPSEVEESPIAEAPPSEVEEAPKRGRAAKPKE